MDSVEEDKYVQKIEEFALDEDKIVNCKWLSDILKVSIDSSKHYLEKFVKIQRKANPDLLKVWYILEGITKETNEHSIQLVAEKNLASEREKYLTISSDFIFIISKNKSLDPQGICLSYDLQSQEKPTTGTFISPNCIKRKRKQTPKKAPTKNIQIEQVNTKTSTGENKSINSTKQTTSVPKGKASGISSFFTKGQSKSNTQSQKINSSQSSLTAKTQNGNSQNKNESSSTGTTQNGNAQIKNELQDSSNSESELTSSLSKVTVETPAEQDIKKESPQKQTKQKTNSDKSKGKKRDLSNSKKRESTSKRRKRIVVESDSEDDIFASDKEVNEEDVEKMEVPEEVIEVAKPLPPKKNKKRKLVEQTFTDSEGFIITKKEWIYENGEESEEESKPPAQTNGTTQKKSTSIEEKKPVLAEVKEKNSNSVQEIKGKGKKGKKTPPGNQPTLMNFFQRK